MRSPGPAPERKIALPCGTVPKTTISARTPCADCEVSPPANVTLNSSAKFNNPFRNRSTHLWGKVVGTANERKAAIGSPPIAAMSLNPRARQRRPTTSGGCHSRRKCTPSRLKSVVTSVSCRAGIRRTAQSSPIPATTAAGPPTLFETRKRCDDPRARIREIRICSGKGKAKT